MAPEGTAGLSGPHPLPDVAPLLAAACRSSPDPVAAAVANGLPLALCAPALDGRSGWAEALAADRQRCRERDVTLQLVRSALPWAVGLLELTVPAWRAQCSPEAELALPAWALDRAAAHLGSAGLTELPRWSPPGERLLARLAGGEVADVVRLVPRQDPARALLRRVARQGQVTAADLGDAQLVGLSQRPPPGLDRPERRAAAALARALGDLASGRARLPRQLRPTPGPGPGRARGAVVLAGGPGAPVGELAQALAQALERLGVPVRRLAGRRWPPGPGVALVVWDGRGDRPAPARLLGRADLVVAAAGPGGWPSLAADRVDLALPGPGDPLAELVAEALGRLGRRAVPLWRHPGIWRVLAPARPGGPVALADLDALSAHNLVLSYPGAVVLARTAGQLDGLPRRAVWDGRRPPLRPGCLALAVADDRQGAAAALAPAMAPGAGQVSLVPSRRPHDYALYPTPQALEWVAARGWPTMGARSLRKRLARLRATTPAWRLMCRVGLRVAAGGESLADQVAAQLSQLTGEPAAVRGLFVGRGTGQTTLRVRLGRLDAAVRLGLTQRGVERLLAHQDAQNRVAQAAAESSKAFSVPEELACGWAGGVYWVAERWVEGRPGPGGRQWWARGPGWAHSLAVADALSRHAPTGELGEGWARRWCSELGRADPAHLEEVVEALCVLEAAGVPAAWCHGDLWPGNVFLRRGRPPAVIDWDRARPDAPAGLDGVYSAIYRVVVAESCTLGQATARLVGRPERVAQAGPLRVGGRPWDVWPLEVRRALVVAAFVRNASGGSGGQPVWDEDWVRTNAGPVVAALRQAGRATGSWGPGRPGRGP
jgi:hypothetical protein